MKYTEILQKLKDLKVNYAQAKKQGATQRANRYKYKIDDLEQKRIKAEFENSSDVLKEQKELIVKLEKQLKGYNKVNKTLKKQIKGLEAKIEGLFLTINPPEPIEKEPEKTSCPKCQKWFTEDKMTEHQKNCKSKPY